MITLLLFDFSTDEKPESSQPTNLPHEFKPLFGFLEGVGCIYGDFMRNGSEKM